VTKKDRKDFSAGTKIDTLINQGFCCAECHAGFTKRKHPHFDHIRGRSDRSPSNCQALCPNCHNNKHIEADRMNTEKQRKAK